MYQSRLFHTTLRETPAEAEVLSHQLLLKGGYIRPVASGVYSYTVLGYRVLRKIEHIVRAEMDRAGAQEVLLPVLQPTDLWNESGRYHNYGPELMTIEDRHKRSFVLGPTHEEVITTLVKQEINSYRKLPITLYQIQTKFRDERRPRFGLLRGREFLMKDAYSFDTSLEGLNQSYEYMKQAYDRIFTTLNINYRAVEADGGQIGGEAGTHEFIALAPIGEDTIVACTYCQYAANIEKAEVKIEKIDNRKEKHDIAIDTNLLQKVYTPHIQSVEQLTKFFNVEPSHVLKTIIFIADGQPVAVVISGQYEINELKVKNYLRAEKVEMADEHDLITLNTVFGYVGPIGLTIPILFDHSISSVTNGIIGANEEHFHYTGINIAQHFNNERYGDFRNVVDGDNCPRCNEGMLKCYRGIEMGHIFKLGTKYSTALKATYLNKQGKTEPMIMGCYGIGISRLLSVAIEQHNQEQAIIWPDVIAPYLFHIIVVSMADESQLQALKTIENNCADNILIDDRDERVGVKFKDADLIGIPYRLIIGKGAKEGQVEWLDRRRGIKETISIDKVLEYMSLANLQ